MSNLFPLCAVLLLIVAVGVHARLQRAAQPLRLELAEKGERFLARRDISPYLRDRVEFLLDTAFDFRGPMLLGLVITPVLMGVLLANKKVFDRVVRLEAGTSANERQLFMELALLHQRISLANHPILMLLFELEMILLVPPALLIVGAVRGRMPTGLDRNMVANMVEAEPQAIRRLLAA